MKIAGKQIALAAVAGLLGYLVYREYFTKEGRRHLQFVDLGGNKGFAVFTTEGNYVRCEDNQGALLPDSACAGSHAYPADWQGGG